MKKIILAVLLLITYTIANSQVKTSFPVGTKIPLWKEEPKKNYFPKTCFDDFENKWYSIQLTALNEQVLYNSDSTNDVYRFTWLRSFDPPIAISIIKNGDSYLLTWKECNGSGGHEPGKLIVNKQKVITKANWDFFQYRLKQLGFWKMTTKEKINGPPGTDGAEWILEGKTPNRYHVTDRWTPHEGTDYYKCCDYLLSLTDLQIVKDRKY